MFAFPFWFLYEPAYEHSEAHILEMYPSVWVRYWYRSAQKNSGYVTVDLLDAHLDLLDTDIFSKQFVCLREVFKTSSRHVFNRSSRHMFKTSWRRLQRNNFLSSKTSSRCLQEVFKTSSRRLRKTSSRRFGRQKIVTLKTCWRRLQDMSSRSLQDVLKTNECFLGYLFSASFCGILIRINWQILKSLLHIGFWILISWTNLVPLKFIRNC